MKTKSTLCILLISTQISFAQDGKLWLSLGAGTSGTASSNKNNLIGNGFNLQAEAFVPFYKKTSHFTLGVNVVGNYTGLRNMSPNNADVAGQYQVFNGNLSVASQSKSKTSGSFSGLMGIQGHISLGKFNIAPSLNAGYLRLDQKGFTQMGNATINGQTQEKELIKSENQTTNGFIFKPQIKMGYSIAQNFTLFVGPAIVMGPELTHTTQYLVPQGGFNDRKMYEASQLAKGTWESKTANSRYGLTEVNFGMSVALGKKKVKVKPSGAVSSSYAKAAPVGSVAPTPNNATDFNTTRNNRERGQLKRPDTLYQEWDNMIAENLLKTSKNADTSTAGMVTKAGVSTSRSGIIRTGNAKLAENDTNTNDTTGANQRLSMNVTTPKQTQGKTFGESMANGLQTSSNTVGKSINEKGIKRNETVAMAKPGQPIGGIVVKGGKNPGGNLITTTTNNNGEFVFTALEKGNYKFSFTIPAEAQDFNTTRNNRERGQLATNSGSDGKQHTSNPNQLKAQNNNTIRSGREESTKLVTDPNSSQNDNLNQLRGQNNNTVRSNRTDNALKIEADTGSNLIPAINNISSRIRANNNQETSNQLKAQNNNTVRSNRTDNAYKLNGDGSTSNPEKAETQDFNTTRSNRERGQVLAAKPGSPIGGIVVKGGKNPSPGNGWGAINVISDENGEVTFNVTEPGEYKLQITAPEPNGKTVDARPKADRKSINEKGVRASMPTNSKRRRVEVLKSNKNAPQGKSINEKGVSGSKSQPKAKQKTQVDKTTSGLKDIVKTQV